MFDSAGRYLNGSCVCVLMFQRVLLSVGTERSEEALPEGHLQPEGHLPSEGHLQPEGHLEPEPGKNH